MDGWLVGMEIWHVYLELLMEKGSLHYLLEKGKKQRWKNEKAHHYFIIHARKVCMLKKQKIKIPTCVLICHEWVLFFMCYVCTGMYKRENAMHRKKINYHHPPQHFTCTLCLGLFFPCWYLPSQNMAGNNLLLCFYSILLCLPLRFHFSSVCYHIRQKKRKKSFSHYDWLVAWFFFHSGDDDYT